jgi:hypothetical protein
LDFSKPSSEIESRRIKKGETAPGNTRGRFTTRRYTKRRLVLMVADASSDWQLSRRFFILSKQHRENAIGDLYGVKAKKGPGKAPGPMQNRN